MLSDLDRTLLKLEEIESWILDARCSGVSICAIDSEQDLKKKGAELISRISAQCGCATPTTEVFFNVLVEEVCDFMLRYGNGELCFEEYLLASRINSMGGYKFPSGLELERVPFVGNCFNVEYLSKLTDNYFRIRLQLDRKLQNLIDGY